MVACNQILKAIEFATKAHAGQFRKNSSTPYIVHPLGVSAIVAAAGASKETIIAAVLHDVVEDCGVSLDQIQKKFGAEVAYRVEQVTEVKDGRSWRQRKNDALRKVDTMRRGAVLIKQADVLYNITDCLNNYRASQEFMSKESLEHYVRIGQKLAKIDTPIARDLYTAAQKLSTVITFDNGCEAV